MTRRYGLLTALLIGIVAVAGLIVLVASRPTPTSNLSPLENENTTATTIAAETEAVTATPTETPAPLVITATPFPGEVRIDLSGARMVYVPAGRYVMGSALEEAIAICERTRSSSDCLPWRFVNGTPPHEVEVSAFWLDQFEVSTAQYAACVVAGVCAPPSENTSFQREAYYGEAEFAAFPAIYVDWTGASAFCAWRGARLPTEIEWEYASRGPQNLAYPWGDAMPDETYANFGMMTGDTIAPETYPAGASWVNAYHLIGNVWEWTASPYAPYPGYEDPPFEVPPEGRFNAAYYVIRGGSWGTDRGELAASRRFGHATDMARSSTGFRCAVGGEE